MRPAELWLLDDARIMGGGQLFALRLARYVLSQRGRSSVRIVCPAGSDLARRAEDLTIPVYDMDFPAPGALPVVVARAVTLRRMVHGREVLVVAGSARCQAVAAAAGLGPRLVHLMHEQESASRSSVRLVQRHIGRVVAVGANTARAYRSAALRNFLLDEDFDRLGAVAHRLCDGTLGVLARLIPEKGVLELIAELRDVSDWQRLLVAGPAQDADYAARVRASAGERVQLLGEVADPLDLLTRIDTLVVPSVGQEAQPTVIVEALAAGKPVIVREPVYSSDFAGLPVFAYGDLGTAIRQSLAADAADQRVVRDRFGAAQALAVIEHSVT